MSGVVGVIRGLFGGGGGFGQFAEKTVGIVGKFIKDKDAANLQMTQVDMAQLAAELEVAMAEFGVEEKVLELEKTASEGITAQNLADAESSDPVQKQWRPKASLRLVNLLIGVVLAEFGLKLTQQIYFPESEMDLTFEYTRELLFGVFSLLGVYMGGRSFEKLKGISHK
jgi:hypothetical protein